MKTSCGKFLHLAHYFPYDVKLRLLAHSGSFLANQKARNAIVGAENLLTRVVYHVNYALLPRVKRSDATLAERPESSRTHTGGRRTLSSLRHPCFPKWPEGTITTIRRGSKRLEVLRLGGTESRITIN